jgi:ribosomal protein S25
MEGGVIALIIFASIIYPFILIRGIKRYYRKHYRSTKHKISDATIFKLMAKANRFLSQEQLAAVSSLTEKEAGKHLMHLSLEGSIKGFQDGGGKSVYCLMEVLPEEDVFPISIEGLNDQQILDQVLLYSDDYQLTVAELVVVFGLDVAEAKIVLKRLKKSGLVSTLWRGFTRIHVIVKSLQQGTPKLTVPIPLKQQTKIRISNQDRIKIPDADVISLAVEYKGRLTPTLLCLKMKIPIQEAKIKLEELYEQDVFLMQVDDENALLEYQLRDKSLFSK